MKILNILFDDRYGGPQKRVIQVAKKLLENNIETVVCLPDRGGDASTFADKQGLTVKQLEYSKMPNPRSLKQLCSWFFFLPRDIFRFKRLFKQVRPDLVHINGAFFIQPAIAARLSAIPIVWHLNDTIIPVKIAGILGKVVKLLATKVVVAADAVAKHYGIEEHYLIIYAPVDVEKFMGKSRWEISNNAVGNEVRIGLIANWNPVKGIEFFIKAASELKSMSQQKFKFVFAGKKVDTHKAYADMLENQIKELGLETIIENYGFVSSVESILENLDILVLSSLSEACPMAVLEGMAAGVPVVATDVGGVRELLEPGTEYEAGIVVPSRDSHLLALALYELVNNKENHLDISYNGRKSACSNFSLQACVDRHRSVYKSCLKKDI